MAITVYKIKSNSKEIVLKILNDSNTQGSVEVEVTDDILQHSQENQTSSPKIDISAIECALHPDAVFKVIRNSNVVLNAHTNTNQVLSEYSSINQENGSKFVFTFTGEGMVSIRLLKVAGFSPNSGYSSEPTGYAPLGFTWVIV